MRNIAYHQNSTISSSVALSLGVLLVIIITQVAYGVRDEIKQPQGSMLPSYFLIDIQPEQLNGLQELIKSNNLKLEYLSPLIRARLTSVNGEVVGNRYNAESEENRGRFRAFNLSYRTGLFPSETIIQGQALSSKYYNTLPAEISVEEKFATRNNLNIGDNLVFDIQGIEIEAVIKNLRRVKWNSFQPNFFVLFQPQALELAPKTYIANIPDMVVEQKTTFKRMLANNYSNISVVDIQKLITTVLNISTKALQLILLLAFLVVLSGFMVVFSITVMRSYDKKGELALFKTLGLGLKELRRLTIIELTLPIIIALILGAILGILASFAISYVAFGSIFSIYLEAVILVSIIALLLITLLSWFIGDYVSKVKVMFNLEQQN